MGYDVLVAAVTVLAWCEENEPPDAHSAALLAQYQADEWNAPIDQVARAIVTQYLNERGRFPTTQPARHRLAEF